MRIIIIGFLLLELYVDVNSCSVGVRFGKQAESDRDIGEE